MFAGGFIRQTSDAKGADVPSPSGVPVDAEKVKPSVFLLVTAWRTAGP